jgi:hypothetical protein
VKNDEWFSGIWEGPDDWYGVAAQDRVLAAARESYLVGERILDVARRPKAPFALGLVSAKLMGIEIIGNPFDFGFG